MIRRRGLLKSGVLAAGFGVVPRLRVEAQTPARKVPASRPVRVSSRWQLFVDDHVLRATRGVTRSVNYPVRIRENPIFEHAEPWEGYAVGIPQVLEKSDGTLEMFYGTYSLEEGPRTCYATSRDGIRWERPTLGLVEYSGSKQNNILLVPEGTKDAMLHSIYRDPEDPNPARRYKMLYFDFFAGSKTIALGAAFSADGLVWSKHRGNPVYEDTGDTGSILNVKVGGKFVFFHKARLPVRSVRRIESADFVHWAGERMVLYPDELDAADCEFYGMSAFEYEGIYLGLIWVYHTYPDTLDMQLAWSRDSVSWQRAAARRIFMPRGRSPEAWDRYQIYPGAYPVVRSAGPGGAEIWLYYEGWNGPHNQEARQGKIGLAKIRPQGFVFLDASDEEAVVETRPLEYAGKDLLVSADIRAGGGITVRVPGTEIVSSHLEPLDAKGQIHKVAWAPGQTLPRGAGPVSFEIRMRRAHLFGLRFQ